MSASRSRSLDLPPTFYSAKQGDNDEAPTLQSFKREDNNEGTTLTWRWARATKQQKTAATNVDGEHVKDEQDDHTWADNGSGEVDVTIEPWVPAGAAA